jgi:tetratricopeptide (TPR) repeat protein
VHRPQIGVFASKVRVIALLASLSAGAVWAQDTQVEKSFHQGTEALRQGQLDQAAAAFTETTLQRPTFAEAYFNLGLVRLQQKQFDEAIVALTKAIKLKPSLRGANLFLGVARYRTNDYADAATLLSRETRLEALNADAWMWLGVVQLAAGESAAAVVSLDKAAALRPNDVDILYHRGQAHMLVSKQSYEHIYQVDPNSWRIHQVLAQSFVEQDRLDEAAKECQQAIELKPLEPGLHEELADIYWKQNQLSEAESEFQAELKIDSESVSSMYKLAAVSIERSKPQIAGDLLNEVLRRNPHNVDAHYQLGRAEAQLGRSELAIENFSQAITDSAQQPDSESVRQSYYQLAQLYRREQKPAQSRAALDSFMRLKQQADARQAQKLQDKLKRSSQVEDTNR